jgi:hypothetical protein
LLESEQGERTIFVAEHHTHEGMIAYIENNLACKNSGMVRRCIDRGLANLGMVVPKKIGIR